MPLRRTLARAHLRTLVVSCVVACVLGATDAAAQAPRISRDVTRRLASNSIDPTCLILPGTQAEVDRVAARHGLRVHKRLGAGAVVEVPAETLSALTTDAGVVSASGNYKLRARMDVTVTAIGADQVWEDGWGGGQEGVRGAGIGVAVIDTGVAEVPELKGRIVVSVDFTATSKHQGPRFRRTAEDCGGSVAGVSMRPGDANGHGTHVAGIIAADGAIQGVAPAAHIISLKVLDAHGEGYASDVVEAIDWAIANRERYAIRVLNLSLGGPVLQRCADDPVCQAVERAYRAGLVVVASAGNQGKDETTGAEVYGRITVPGTLRSRSRWARSTRSRRRSGRTTSLRLTAHGARRRSTAW